MARVRTHICPLARLLPLARPIKGRDILASAQSWRPVAIFAQSRTESKGQRKANWLMRLERQAPSSSALARVRAAIRTARPYCALGFQLAEWPRPPAGNPFKWLHPVPSCQFPVPTLKLPLATCNPSIWLSGALACNKLEAQLAARRTQCTWRGSHFAMRKCGELRAKVSRNSPARDESTRARHLRHKRTRSRRARRRANINNNHK